MTNEKFIPQSSKLKQSANETEKQLIIHYLLKHLFNYSQAAKDLQVDRKTLYNKILSFGIDLNKLKLEAAAKLISK